MHLTINTRICVCVCLSMRGNLSPFQKSNVICQTLSEAELVEFLIINGDHIKTTAMMPLNRKTH